MLTYRCCAVFFASVAKDRAVPTWQPAEIRLCEIEEGREGACRGGSTITLIKEFLLVLASSLQLNIHECLVTEII